MCLLGFDNLVEGRIPSVLVDFQREYSLLVATQWTAERWASGLVQRLLSLTHRQWLYRRNAMVHSRGSDGYTRLFSYRTCQNYYDTSGFYWVDPEDLLPQDRGLLDDDFDILMNSEARLLRVRCGSKLWRPLFPLLNTLANRTLTNFVVVRPRFTPKGFRILNCHLTNFSFYEGVVAPHLLWPRSCSSACCGKERQKICLLIVLGVFYTVYFIQSIFNK